MLFRSLERNELIDLLHRNELVGAAVMPGLTAGGSPRRRFRWTRGSGWGIAGRRSRRVSGVLVEPSLKTLDSLLLSGDLSLQQSNLSRLSRQCGFQRGDDLPAGSVFVAFGFPRLHYRMKPAGGKKDSSEVGPAYKRSRSLRVAEIRPLTP